MLPKTHFFIGLLVSILIYLLFPSIGIFSASVILLSSVLIDFDHYLYYVIKKKNFSLKKAYTWFFNHRKIFIKLTKKQKENFERTIIIFHGIECWILLLLLMYFNKIFLFILLGVIIHMVLDFIELYLIQSPFHIKTSQIYVHIKNKNTKNLIKL